MESFPTILVVASDAITFFVLVRTATTASNLEPVFGDATIDHFFSIILEPHLWNPVDANEMCPHLLLFALTTSNWLYDSIDVWAEEAFNVLARLLGVT